MAAFFFVLGAAGWSYGEPVARLDPVYVRATTACLVAIVVMQIANVFLCRSPHLSIFTLGPLSNRLILGGVLLEIGLILLIVYTGPGNSIFDTAPVSPAAWLLALPFALAMIILEEGRKWLARRRNEAAAPCCPSG
jgi:magnesium-transporting ATPase (P-type)